MIVNYKSKSWKNIPPEKFEELRQFLLLQGGKQDDAVKGVKELWRIRIDKTIFTLWETGTLFGTTPQSSEEFTLQQEITKLLGQIRETPTKDFLIGFDETGKGEVLGHTILAGVVIPKELENKVDTILGSSDTKQKRSVGYWDGIYSEIDDLRSEGLYFITEKIPPWHVDKYNINKIMDVVYQRLIGFFTRMFPLSKCRIIIDDYGIGYNLDKYLKSLDEEGAEIRVETKADEKYVEARLASVVSKRERVKVMEAVAKSYSLKDAPLGSGNAGDPVTKKWLIDWRKTGQDWPWFVKRSYKTIREIEGKEKEAEKIEPPIRHELISKDSRKRFHEGKLSTESLTICCPECGTILRSCKVVPIPGEKLVARCMCCDKEISDVNTTLLYYCGYIVPDSSIIISGLLSKDLEGKRFFENFNFLLHPIVKRECDNKGGRKELGRLAQFSSIGRIHLIELSEDFLDVSGTDDDKIVDAAKKTNSLVFTRDGGMESTTTARQIFYLKS